MRYSEVPTHVAAAADRCPRGRIAARGNLPQLLSDLSDPSVAATALDSLGDLLRDQDAALEAGFRGGHAALLALLCAPTLDGDDGALADAAAAAIDAATTALPAGWGFPMAPSPTAAARHGRPAVLDCSSFVRCPPLDADLLAPWLPPGAATAAGPPTRPLCAALTPGLAADLCVHLRPVPSTIRRQSSQEDVGQALWPAAPVLSRWIVAHCELLAGAEGVLELGAGVGAAGITAGVYAAAAGAAAAAAAGRRVRGVAAGNAVDVAARASLPPDAVPPPTSATSPLNVVLTDFNPAVLANLRYNAQLNDPAANLGAMPAMAALVREAEHGDGRWWGGLPRVSVASHDWDALLPAGVQAGATMAAPARPVVGEGPSHATDAGAADRAAERKVGAVPLPADTVYDVLFASDTVCCVGDAWGAAASIARHLRRPAGAGAGPAGGRFARHGGVAVLLQPPSFARYGVDQLGLALAGCGLAYETRTVHPAFTRRAYGASERAETVSSDSDPRVDAADVVVAGGKEDELQMWVVSWRAGGGV